MMPFGNLTLRRNAPQKRIIKNNHRISNDKRAENDNIIIFFRRAMRAMPGILKGVTPLSRGFGGQRPPSVPHPNKQEEQSWQNRL